MIRLLIPSPNLQFRTKSYKNRHFWTPSLFHINDEDGAGNKDNDDEDDDNGGKDDNDDAKFAPRQPDLATPSSHLSSTHLLVILMMRMMMMVMIMMVMMMVMMVVVIVMMAIMATWNQKNCNSKIWN